MRSSKPSHLLPVLGAAALALPAAAQTTKLISTGDPLPGLGAVTLVRELDVNAAGDWIASVRTDEMTGINDVALVRNGVVVLKPGDAVPGIPGAGFTSATRIALDGAGNYGWREGINTNGGAYVTATPFLLPGDPIAGAGLVPGIVCKGVYDYVFEPGGTLLVNARMTNQSPFGMDSRALVRAAPLGSGVPATTIVKPGDVLPGHSSTVWGFSTEPNTMDSNAAGSVIYGPWFFDNAEGIYLNGVKLALTGEISPSANSLWTSFDEQPVAVNDAGDVVFSGRVTATAGGQNQQLIVRNGTAFAREGDFLPAIAPYSLTFLSGSSQVIGAPLRLTQDGRVLWYAAWNDPDVTRDSGLFLDHELIAQEGVTQVGGVAIDEFWNFQMGKAEFDVSPDGKQVYVRALLANGEFSAFILPLEGKVEAIAGCVPNPGALDSLGLPNLGEIVLFSMLGGQSASALPFVFLSTKTAMGTGSCGIAIPGIGEVLIDVTAPNPFAVVKGSNLLFPVPALAVLGPLPQFPQLLGKTFYAQGLWLDVANPNPADAIRLTNALALSIGL